jgi:hypothetical protein
MGDTNLNGHNRLQGLNKFGYLESFTQQAQNFNPMKKMPLQKPQDCCDILGPSSCYYLMIYPV